MNKIVRLFLDTDMRNGHLGLSEIAKKQKIDVKNLNWGEHVIFLNNQKNRLKIFSRNNFVSYYWQEHGKIDLNTIHKIPECFVKSGKLNMNKAIKRTLLEKLENKKIGSGSKKVKKTTVIESILKQSKEKSFIKANLISLQSPTTVRK